MRLLGVAAMAAAALVSLPASAQKSKDTLQLAINNPFAVLSSYNLPVDEAAIFSHEVYEYLLSYDEYKKKYVPGLAKSWKRIDDTTLEFELRDDIKFHNGDKFGADDVIETVKYISDPKSKITYGSRYTWIDKVEKMGGNKIRIHAKEPNATDLGLLAYRVNIWDGKLLSKLENKADYGRVSPVGTGVYKVVEMDKNAGITVERYAGYNTNTEYRRAPIKRIHGKPLPDRQTQVAELITGGVQLLRNVPPDQANALRSEKGLTVTNVPSPSIFYIALDSVGRSGFKPTQDPRVREAVALAIDRDKLIKNVVPGGEVATKLDALCFKETIACKYTVKAPGYDPARAKRLLAEAGYPDGFDMEYLVYAPNKPLGEAVAGELRKVGIRATINAATIGLYRRAQGDGKLNAWSILFPTGSHPDAGNILAVYLSPAAAKYYDDDELMGYVKAAQGELNPEKRANLYAKAFDRINSQHYIYPISSIPDVYVHSKDVEVKPNSLSAGVIFVSDYHWKK